MRHAMEALGRVVESVIGKGRRRVWEISLNALVGASDRYLASLDDHIAFELDGSVLLISFAMTR